MSISSVTRTYVAILRIFVTSLPGMLVVKSVVVMLGIMLHQGFQIHPHFFLVHQPDTAIPHNSNTTFTQQCEMCVTVGSFHF